MVSRTLVAVAAVLLGGAALIAQQNPPVRFKTEVNLVEIDAIVTDRDGRFVPGLTKDDFEILEEGNRQDIAAFEVVRIPVAPPAPVAASAASAIAEPDAVSNAQPVDGRLFVLLLDDLQTSTPMTAYVRKTAREFIERHAAANDLVAIAFTSARSPGQDFTSSRSRLFAAIDRFAGLKLPGVTGAKLEDFLQKEVSAIKPQAMKNAVPAPQDPYEVERAVHAKTSMGVMQHLSEFLGGIRGRRKALVYVGEGLDYDLQDTIEINLATIQRDTLGVIQAINDAMSAATRNNVSIYTIDPRGLVTGLEEQIRMPTIISNPKTGQTAMKLEDELNRSHLMLRAWAGQTGGLPFVNTNDLSTPLQRIVEDSSSFYILGYYAPIDRKDGRFRNVQVRVNREGLTVRARRGYYAPRADAPAARAKAVAEASEALTEAMRNPLPVNGLPFSVNATPFQGRGKDSSVALVIETPPGAVHFANAAGSPTGSLEVLVVASDPLASRRVAATRHVANLRPNAETYESITRDGVRIIRRMDLGPGRYRLQVGVRDRTSGNVGTVVTDLDVPNLVDPPLAMSGIVIVSAAATRTPTVSPDETLDAILPGAHTARRVFSPNDRLVVFAEFYANTAKEPVSVRTTIVHRDGGVVHARTVERPAVRRWPHRVDVPAGQLGTGQFILRIEASTAAGASVARAIPFEIR